jgi:hypothetical protein
MTPPKSSAVIKKTASSNKRKNMGRTSEKFASILEELQILRNYENTKMDFSRYNTLEEYMQLLDESSSWRGHSKSNHKLAANV